MPTIAQSFRYTTSIGSPRAFGLIFLTLLTVAWLLPSAASAGSATIAPCPACEAQAAAVDAARQELDEHRQEAERIQAELLDNAAKSESAEQRTDQIQAEIDRQQDTFASAPQPDGSTLSSRYDLSSGEIVTTRTRPDGSTEEVSRTPSRSLQSLNEERAGLEALLQDLAAQRTNLLDQQAANTEAIGTATARTTEAERQLADCVKLECPPRPTGASTTALLIETEPHKEFVINPGEDPNKATSGMTGVTLFALPDGGWQASVPIPHDSAAAAALAQRLEQLVAQGKISDLQDEPCRKFLPDSTPVAGREGTLPATGQPVEIMKGEARTSGGAPPTTAVVIVFPLPPPVTDDASEEDDDKGAGWIPGLDDRPPSFGIVDPTGAFVVVLASSSKGPLALAVGVYCHCFQVTGTAPAGNETATSSPNPGTSADGTTQSAGESGVPIVAGGNDDEGTQTRTPPGSGSSSGDPSTDDPRDVPDGTDPRDLPSDEKPCYCGPDMSFAVSETINRLKERLDKLPDSEYGIIDGPLFLNRNGDSFDTPPAAARRPDAPEDANATEGWLCPSPECRVWGKYMSAMLCGYCLPWHMFNEINAAFTASKAGVPFVVLAGGANTRELINYQAFEGNAPITAYRLGYDLAEAIDTVGELTPPQICKMMRDRMQQQWPASQQGVVTMPSFTTGTLSAWDLILKEYPTLANCKDCPDRTPGRFLKDFSRSRWQLDDGTWIGSEYSNRGDDE